MLIIIFLLIQFHISNRYQTEMFPIVDEFLIFQQLSAEFFFLVLFSRKLLKMSFVVTDFMISTLFQTLKKTPMTLTTGIGSGKNTIAIYRIVFAALSQSATWRHRDFEGLLKALFERSADGSIGRGKRESRRRVNKRSGAGKIRSRNC